MASFSTHIKSKFELETYKGTKDTYEWIIASLKKLNLNYEKIEKAVEKKKYMSLPVSLTRTNFLQE